MPVSINNPTKRFGVKFIRKDQYTVETMTVEDLGRTGARDQVLRMHPGAEILECWQDGTFRTR